MAAHLPDDNPRGSVTLTVGQARDLVEAAMVKAGHTPAEASVISHHLIDSELRGLSFGGLPRALSIVERLQATPGPRRPMRVVKEGPHSAAIDGGDQVGYLVGQRATDVALEKARALGLAVVGAYETWYTGMYSYYLEQVTQAGFVGMIAGSAPQIVAPHGGSQARFGTNPIAFGFPADPVPIIWDIGTASIMAGEVAMHARAGTPLPEGAAFDKDGQPTRDALTSVQGAWTVWGGHKGSGLAMVIQLLGMMCGAAAAPDGIRDCGFFLFVINPELLTSADDFHQRVGAYAESLRATRPLDPTRPVRVPFERSAAERARRSAQDAIEVPANTYAALTRFVTGPFPATESAALFEKASTMSITGSWNLVIKSPMGEQTSTLTLQAQGNQVTGSMSGANGASTVEDGKADGDTVTWTARITSPMPLILEFSGKVIGDTLAGEVKLGAFGSAPFSGTRA